MSSNTLSGCEDGQGKNDVTCVTACCNAHQQTEAEVQKVLAAVWYVGEVAGVTSGRVLAGVHIVALAPVVVVLSRAGLHLRDTRCRSDSRDAAFASRVDMRLGLLNPRSAWGT